MDPERWKRVRDAVEAAIGLDAAVRASVLDRFALTPDDRREAEALLAAHDASGGFLAEPASVLTHLVSDAPLPSGRMLGNYSIDREIGRGGMGIIYRAHDTRLGRDVAIKVLPPALANDVRRRARLEREARAAAAVSHPGVALVYALEADASGTAFIVSELVDGVTLREELAQGPLPVAVALATAAEVARAVSAAHARGVVHRDLKPENIMRTRAGRVKVLDFGLARVPSPAGRLTLDGEIMGTRGYMAPEQLRGEDSAEAIDIFAMGVLLRELITGHTAAGTLGGRVVPPDLARVIDRATAPDPAARFASMAELADAIDRVSAAPATDVRAPSLAWWRVHQAVIATLYSQW